MSTTWRLSVLAALFVAGCGPSGDPKKDPPPAKRDTSGIRVVENEGAHVLVKPESAPVAPVKAPSLVLVRIKRNGEIESNRIIWSGERATIQRAGASDKSGCCTAEDPPEMRAMGSSLTMLRDSANSGGDSVCAEPVILDGDHKAPWHRVQMLISVMARARMQKLTFATGADVADLKGWTISIPAPWDPGQALPAEVTRIDVAASGRDLRLTVAGAVHADVASAVKALQAAGAKRIAVHPTDGRTPLWAVLKGVEAALLAAPAEPVWFDLAH